MSPVPEKPVAYYDAGCAFCTRSAELARSRGADVEFRPGAPSDTMVLEEGGRRFERSEAALRLALRMRAPWRWLARMGLLVPRTLRDRVYDAVARNRHRLRKGRGPAP